MKFEVINLGCKVNRVEADSVTAALLERGHSVALSNDADLVVVNTCTVTGEADKKARKAVRHALAKHPNARVIVSGCAVAIDPDEYDSIDERVEVVPRAQLAEKVGSIQDSRVLRVGDDFNTRVNIKIQDGCDNACTYCIVHVARGKATSRSFDETVNEVVRYARAGVREIILTGINIGTYKDDGKTLADLLLRLLEETKELPNAVTPTRFRVSSIEPQDLTNELIDVVANANGRVCRHFHLPLQSGSTKVLREMDRRYSSDEFNALIDRIYGKIPTAAISTDVIVGFPGETDEDFEKTVQCARRNRFVKIHVFPYSRREGTPAAARKDQVPDDAKRKRAKQLRQVSKELREQEFAKRIGTTELALVEPDYALTESYFELPVPPNCTVGSLVNATFLREPREAIRDNSEREGR